MTDDEEQVFVVVVNDDGIVEARAVPASEAAEDPDAPLPPA